MKQSYDLIVAGGGPAGVAAAVAAARGGADTLLIEHTGCLGGMGTSGLVGAWCPFTDGKRLLHGGIGAEVVRRTTRQLACLESTEIPHGHIPFDPEYLKLVLDELVRSAGVQVLFHTVVADAETEGRKLRRVTAANKSGIHKFEARCYIDCTGDGDLAGFAGAEFIEPQPDEETMPGSLCFVLSNIDSYSYTHVTRGTFGGNPASPIWTIMADPRYADIESMHLTSNLVGPATAAFNAGHLYFDATDPESVTQAMFQGRKLANRLTEALHDCGGAAFAAAHLAQTASLAGVRESHRIRGRYELTLADYRARRDFPDSIGRNCYYVDVHQGKHKQKQCRTYEGWQAYMREMPNADWNCGPGESHGIPFRILQPEKLDNLLVAGRCVCCDKAVFGSLRVMPNAFTTGEAAGTAAALMIRDSIDDSGKLNIEELRTELIQNGAIL